MRAGWEYSSKRPARKLWASDANADVHRLRRRRPDGVCLRALIRIGVLGYPATRVTRFKDGETIRVGPTALTRTSRPASAAAPRSRFKSRTVTAC